MAVYISAQIVITIEKHNLIHGCVRESEADHHWALSADLPHTTQRKEDVLILSAWLGILDLLCFLIMIFNNHKVKLIISFDSLLTS